MSQNVYLSLKGDVMLKFDVKGLINTGKMIVQKRAPEILTGVGIAGMITTTVLAVKATPKALMLIEEKKLDTDVEKLSVVETVKTVWPCYIPPMVTGVVSVGCLIGASSVNMRRNAALATAYALSETTLKDYKDKITETLGEKKTEEIRDAIAKDKLEKNPVDLNEVIRNDNGMTLCYEPLSGRYFRSDIESIRRAVNELNNTLLNENYAALNDFYCSIGLGETKLGDQLGWQRYATGLVDIHLGTHLAANGEPCIVVDFVDAPVYDYNRFIS